MRIQIIAAVFAPFTAAFHTQVSPKRDQTLPLSAKRAPHTSSKLAPQAAAAAVLAGSLLFSPTPADAQVSAAAAPVTILNQEYADPFHPYCQRKIEVAADGKSFHYSGTAVGPKGDPVLRGCSPKEIKLYTLRKGAFDGLILADAGQPRISVGDGIHEGIWEPKDTATTNLGYEDVDGIRWDDGNKWVVKDQSIVTKNADGKDVVLKKPASASIGENLFFALIALSALAKGKGVLNDIQKRQADSS